MTAKRSASNDSHLCQFQFADGRKCRMLRHKDHATLCLFHARDEMQLLESQRLGAEIAASLTGRFMTATDVNFVLGKLFTAIAQNRIPPRNAAILAYVGQLLLHSVQGIKDEYKFKFEFTDWQNMLRDSVRLSGSNPRSLNSSNAPPNS
jgi:hypothetical protein